MNTVATRNEALTAWYRSQRRDLPWRSNSSPYAVLVSEVMCQQTQAERAATHYEHFMKRFPTVAELAAAGFRDVAAAWSGLGYNTRAKRLHLAAKQIVVNGWPTTYDGLLGLPGVGPYTAAAVACFAFGAQRPAVDTNLRRVLSRWHGEVLDDTHLEETAAAVMDADAVTWNQAVMDLGATVCLPRRARCDECPVTTWCAGPGVYSPPPRQAPFAGSVREARGAVMRVLIDEPQGFADLVSSTGLAPQQISAAVDGLTAGDLIRRRPDAVYEIVG